MKPKKVTSHDVFNEFIKFHIPVFEEEYLWDENTEEYRVLFCWDMDCGDCKCDELCKANRVYDDPTLTQAEYKKLSEEFPEYFV